jgi:hypothetical protein
LVETAALIAWGKQMIRRMAVVLPVVLCALVAGTGTASAVPSGPPIRIAHSQEFIPLDDLAVDYILPDESFDTADLSGMLHLVTNMQLDEDGAATSLIINANLQGASATSALADYTIVGEGDVLQPSPPPIFPTDPVQLSGSYSVLFIILPTLPPSPILPASHARLFQVELDLTFDSDGALRAAVITAVTTESIGLGD